MVEADVATPGSAAVSARDDSSRAGTRAKFKERRRSPRPRLAEIRQGANLNLLPPTVVAGAVRITEFLLVAILGFAIYLLYVEREGASTHLVYLAAVLIAAAANILLLQAFDLYRVPAFSAFVRSFARIALAWTIVIAGLMSLAFFVKVGADFSRVWIATWYVSTLSALFAERLGLSLVVKRWTKQGRLNRRAVIVGGGPEAEALIKALEASHDTDIRIAGIFDDRGHDRVSPVVAGYPKLGNIDELVEFARASRIDLLIVSLPGRRRRSGCSNSSRSCGYSRSIFACRPITRSCDSAHVPTPISATCPSSTSPTSRSPIGTMCRSSCSTRSWRR